LKNDKHPNEVNYRSIKKLEHRESQNATPVALLIKNLIY